MVKTMALASTIKRGFPLYYYNTLSAAIPAVVTIQSTSPATIGGNVFVLYDSGGGGPVNPRLVTVDPKTQEITTVINTISGSNIVDMGSFTYLNSRGNGRTYTFMIVNTSTSYLVASTYIDSTSGKPITSNYTLNLQGGSTPLSAGGGNAIGVPVTQTTTAPRMMLGSYQATLDVDTNGILTGLSSTSMNTGNIGLPTSYGMDQATTIACSPTTNFFYYIVPGVSNVILAGKNTTVTSNIKLSNTDPIGYTIVKPPTGGDSITLADITCDPYGNLWISGKIDFIGPPSTTVYTLSKFTFSDASGSNGAVTYTQTLANPPSKGLVILDATGNGYYSSTTSNGVFMTQPYYTY
jgi:hypothetical protein